MCLQVQSQWDTVPMMWAVGQWSMGGFAWHVRSHTKQELPPTTKGEGDLGEQEAICTCQVEGQLANSTEGLSVGTQRWLHGYGNQKQKETPSVLN